MQTTVNPEINIQGLESRSMVSVEPSVVTYQKFPATSVSDSVINYTITPPSMRSYINRRIPAHIPLRITFAGNAATPNDTLLQPGCDALRSATGVRITKNSAFNYNGTTINSVAPNDVLSELVTHFDPSYRDDAPLSEIDSTAFYEASFGAINNPLANYSNSTNATQMKRGAYPIRVISNTNTAAVIEFTLIEWIYYPRFLGTSCEKLPGLTNGKVITLSQNIDLHTKNIWSHSNAAGSTITSAVCTIIGQPFLMCKIMTPPSSYPIMDVEYQYMYCEKLLTSNTVAMADATTAHTIVSNNIQIPEIPKYLLLYVRESEAHKTIGHTDTFARIENVSINFNNMANLLSTADARSLWEMSRDCGLLDSYQAFTGLVNSSSTATPFANTGAVGSLVMLQFGRHISLSENNLTIGSSGSFNIQVTVTAKNHQVAGNTVITINNPTLYVVPIYDRSIRVSSNGIVSEITKQSKIEFMGYGVGGSIGQYETKFGGSTIGGTSFTDVHNFVKDNRLISKGFNAASEVMKQTPIAAYSGIPKTLGNFAESIGYGTMNSDDLAKRIMSI